ncbi:MAG: cobalamin-dependent protein [Deltaproteobacteria bacterium]|nr:MAG: cobalamin-dependent protein [Deltaproteobacteria bacterium]
MKFLLVDPPHKIWEFLRAWVPSPGCLQLAAYLERDFDLEFLDCTIQDHPWRSLEERVRYLRPEVVGISVACTYFIYDAMNAARLVKEVSPNSIVIVGGAHPSHIPEETLRECRAIDFICVGEGELTMHEFLSAVEHKEEDFSHILGLAYLDDQGNFIFSGHRPFIEDLDELPMPAYHLYNMEHPYVGLPSEGDRSLLVNFARGCNFACTFCSESVFWRRSYRTRSPKLIGEELELLKEEYNRQIFYVGDNIFNLTREKAEGFVEEMTRRKTGQHLWIQSRADLVIRDEDLMAGLREAGVYQVMIGVEHAGQKFLDEVQKRIRMEQNKRAMEIVRRHGMMMMATLMMGFWDETEDDRRELLKFVHPYVDHFGLNVITPYPGTKFYEEMERLGRLKTKDWSKYDQIEAVMDTRYNTAEEITEAHISLMRRYYWHPRELWKTFFSRRPIIKHQHRHFLKIGVTAFKHEVFGSPMWVQETYQTFEEYLKERGRPLASGL